MAKNRIYSTISAEEVSFSQGTPTKFTVTVTNQSDEFASFQLKLEVKDSDPRYKITSDWYKMSPVVSSKNPPGDSTKFEVEIIKIPTGGTVKGDKILCYAIVSSIELQPDKDRIPFEIKTLIPPQVSIIRQDFDFYRRFDSEKDKQPWEIGIEIYNPGFQPANNVRVELLSQDLKAEWLLGVGVKPHENLDILAAKNLDLLPAGKSEQVIFFCKPDKNAESKTYPFTIQVSNRNSDKTLKGTLEILPTGALYCRPIENEKELDIDKLDKYNNIREKLHKYEKKILQTLYGILLWKKNNDKTYKFKLENKSNFSQWVSLKIDEQFLKIDDKIDQEDEQKVKEVVKLKNFKEKVRVYHPYEICLKPGAEDEQCLKIEAEKAPLLWLLGEKILKLKIKANWSDPRGVNTEGEIQIVKFPVKSIFRIWVLLPILALFSFLLYLVSWLNPASPWFGHQKAVNSVQFNGLGERLVSGSDDTDLIEWQVRGFFNPMANPQIQDIPNKNLITWLSKGFIKIWSREKNNGKKAARVIRYRPVNNNIVAVGLEDGRIKLWNLAHTSTKSTEPIACFLYEEGDRVLALEFSQDSRYLFSGHGSGRVIQWEINYKGNNGSNSQCVSKPERQKQFGFAVYALKFVGEDHRKLAIAGRYNQLLVWDSLEDKTPVKLTYPPGGKDKYIESLDTAEFQPYLLVTADNQGRISLWDLQQCSPSGQCQPVEGWRDGHNEKAVRSVALSTDGCYLVSGGDDGRVMLWFLTPQGKRAEPNGKEIHSNKKQKVNSVDLKIYKETATEQKILIASGWDNNPQVQVQQLWKNDLEYKDCNKP